MDKSNDFSYMKQYLKYAMQFEKYVYIWTSAINESNEQMKNIYSTRQRLAQNQEAIEKRLLELTQNTTEQSNTLPAEAEKYRRKYKSALKFPLILATIISVIGSITMVSVTFKDLGAISLLYIPLIILASIIISYLALFPYCLFSYTSNHTKYKKIADEIQRNNSKTDIRRNILLLNKETETVKIAQNENLIEEGLLESYQDEISESLRIAKKNLAEIYSQNVLPTKYRTFNAVTTLYQYIENGQCDKIKGSGGIYDTYEKALLQGIIIDNLTNINSKLSSIEENQYLLHQELRQANESLCNINQNLKSIEKTNREIAQSTAISAIANQQTAACAQYATWSAWAQGKI